MNVQLSGVGQVVVDDEGHLLDINTTAPNIGGDQDTAAESERDIVTDRERQHTVISNMITAIKRKNGTNRDGHVSRRDSQEPNKQREER